jgi:adenosylcobinamide kinase/adenosylcobinamide-phosphate guanylyltransferase
MSVILVTGGARSGKSSYAEELCKNIGKDICYIATAKSIDSDMEDRIKKHRASRPDDWATIEKYSSFEHLSDNEIFKTRDTFILDCVTIMITNIMFDKDIDYDTCTNDVLDAVERDILYEFTKLINLMKASEKNLIMVTNEVGTGLVPAYRLGSIFRDIAGRMNQFLASQSDEVYMTVCGLPQKLK